MKRSRNHGQSSLPEYTVWRNIRARCFLKSHPAFKNYGARGISICPEWESFERFIADMGRRPSPDHSLDRIDNGRGYEPGNCRWATQREQCRNKRRNRIVTYRGEKLTLVEASERAGIDPITVGTRLHKGWSEERALTEPRWPDGLRRSTPSGRFL